VRVIRSLNEIKTKIKVLQFGEVHDLWPHTLFFVVILVHLDYLVRSTLRV